MFASAKLAPPALLLLALGACGACGDSDDDDADGAASEDAVGEGLAAGEGTYLIGGAGCLSESSSAVAQVDGEAAGDVAGPDAPTPGGGSDADEACAEDRAFLVSAGLLPTGEGTLRLDGREYELGSAALASFAGDVDGQLVLHDGETRVARGSSTSGEDTERGCACGVYDAGAALSVSLVRAFLDDELSGQTYEPVRGDGGRDAEDQALAGGTAVAIDALLVVDADGDGAVSSEAELFEPASGRVVWSGTDEAPSLSFDFVLEDGRSIEGGCEGGYERVE